MSRLIRIAVVLALIVGALFYLESRSGEQPVTTREQPVDLDALAK